MPKVGDPQKTDQKILSSLCLWVHTTMSTHLCMRQDLRVQCHSVSIGFVLHSLTVGAPFSGPLPSPSFYPSAPSLPLNLSIKANQMVSYITKNYKATQMLPKELELFTGTIGNHPGDILQKTLFQRILS